MAEEIIIKINVSSGDAQSKINEVKGSTDQLGKSTKELTTAQKQYEQSSKKLQAALDPLAKQTQINNLLTKQAEENNKKAAAAALQYEGATSKGSKAQKQFRTQAGLQNAILLETGRLASDASFGFTAIANNLSQIITLGQSFVATTGSVSTSLRELVKSLLGSGGLIIGVQLLISFLPKIIKFFEGSEDAIASETEKLIENNKELDKNIAKRKILGRNIEEVVDSFSADFVKNIFDSTVYLNDVENALTEISERFESIGVNNAEVLKDETIATDARMQIANELLAIFNKETEINRFRKQQDEEILNAKKEQRKVNDRLIAQASQNILRARRDIDDLNKDIDRLKKRGVVLTPPDEGDNARRIKRFKQQLLDLSKTILNFSRQAELINATNAQERLDIEERFAKEDADRRLDVFRERQALRLEEFKEQVKGRENANELIKDAEAEFNESMADAKIEHLELLDSIDNAFVTKRILLKDKEGRQLASIERNIENARIDRLDQASGVDELYYQARLKQINTDIETTRFAADDTTRTEQERKQSLLELIRLEDLEREIINKRQLDRIEQRKRIEMEYVGFAQGISQLLGTIAGENEALSKAALIVEKGSAIADIVVNSQAAIATSLANNAMVPTVLPPGIPNPAKAASTAAMLKDISRVKVGAAIGIANILATTISSFSQPKGGGGGAGGGVEVQAPAFNVVGASPVNQLATAVSEASDKQEISFSFNDIDKGLNTVRALETDATVFG